MFKTPEKYRVTEGDFKTSADDGCNGLFFMPSSLFISKAWLKVIASDGEGWEHVSVSLPNRTPKWEEMAYVKSLFWDDDDLVIQYHPPQSDYVNVHPYCLHLWRKAGTNDFCEVPPLALV